MVESGDIKGGNREGKINASRGANILIVA